MSFKTTVPQSTREGRSSDTERQRELDQLRAFANQAVHTVRTLKTESSNTLETIWRSETFPVSTTATVQVKIQGSSVDGTKYGVYEKVAVFRRGASGDAAQIGSTIDKHTPFESDAAIDATVSVVDNRILVKVSDGGVATMNWKAWIEMRIAQ